MLAHPSLFDEENPALLQGLIEPSRKRALPYGRFELACKDTV
jgi:hypothetical protein